ncbi:CRISPR-associated endonuclease Cas3'' [Haloarcula laminariae]|uniref:CRISPR-associated endonuclease Cas3'' n=1 Tax=Haloarcula laminariae TaxID=2961577 RepID=UPI0021C5C031|nr:CRISPR-associated endonuclease Cas3'' [Halomicroarcula laminariae]
MQLPLISHPTRNETPETYTEAQLTPRGDLRLASHNRVVADRAVRLFGNNDATTDVLRAAAALHDFGKATPQFQAYVRPEETATCPDEETTHARLGALATWYVLGELNAPDRDRLAATLAVARHHQALPNAAQYTAETLARAFEEHAEPTQAQLTAIDEVWPEAAEALLAQTPVSDPDWEPFYSWALSGDIASELRDVSARETLGGYTVETEALPKRLYDRTLRFWSALTLADKSHAMDIPEGWIFDLQTLGRGAIEDYIGELRREASENSLEARLNDERERARRQTVRGVHEWLAASSSQIATLTLPTGLGKTFTGLSAAFEARDILADDTQPTSLIVYALPYTSIIEQTREIFENPELWGADPQQSALTVHHYLSETVVHHDEYADADTAATDDETAAFLGEAWRDGTILTTFVQLFESLAGPTNRQGVKLPALESSIIILDEPQALPKDWWDGIVRLLDILTDEYDAHVIAMTATQPSLVRNLQTESLLANGLQHDVAECEDCQQGPTYETDLPPDPKATYFEDAERVRYTIDDTALSRAPGVEETHVAYDSAADRVLASVDDEGSTLAICNTIGSSRELTNVLNARPDVTHLGEAIQDVLNEHDVDAADPARTTGALVDEVMQRVSPASAVQPPNDDQPDPSRDLDSSSETYLLTLTSRCRPFDRQLLIEIADRLSTRDERFVLVSTQAIEAGVDLSFETVFRDIAPLDSIVQAAGRCNRSYEWGRNGGRVIVWMLADPDEATPATPSTDPPAYYVYEKGATDAGVPGHLELISEILASVPDTSDVADATLSRDAVAAYFDALETKSLWSGDLRAAIDDANARWLGSQSLIGGRPTCDVMVAQTAADEGEITAISDCLAGDDPTGFDKLQNAASLRVSLPKSIVEDTPRLPRLDRRERDADGVQVFEHTGGTGLKYDLVSGGLHLADEPISNQSQF